MKPNWRFSILYGVSLVLLVGSELAAVYRARGGETLTAHWRWVGQRLRRWPVAELAWDTATSVLFIWLLAHFLDAARRKVELS